mmetsp:Transcript_4966/g.9340  ORF Transcript_4966/g.9340 Transcript_4966/m.9340 type:complete len:670 (+) Transcript_4966:1052-3061(+)
MKMVSLKYELQQIEEVVAEEEQVEEEAVWRSASPVDRREDLKPISLPRIANEAVKRAQKSLTARRHHERSKSMNMSFKLLKSFPGVTNHLITDADRAEFLKTKRSSRNRSSSPSNKSFDSPRGFLPPLKGGNIESLHPSILEKIKASKEPKNFPKMKPSKRENTSSSSSSVRDLIDNSDNDSVNSRSQQHSSMMSRLRHGRMKSKFSASLDKNNDALRHIFKSICKLGERGFKKVTNASFEAYLAQRYPEAFLGTLSKYFNFGEGVPIEGYIAEFEKFLSLSDDRLLHFVFESFDTNKDHYICYADTFLMIAQRKADTYDRDLTKLRQMFNLKKSRNSPGRKAQTGGRRNSFYNGGQIEEEDTRFKRKRVPYYNPERPEALTFEDFMRVEFGGRPQFIWDFLKHTCGISNQEANITNAYLSRQNTEDVLAEASLSAASLNMLSKDERAPYFKELQDAISQFTRAESQVILSKFKMLKATGTARKMLSKESVLRNFGRFFGAECDYIAERFYELLSGKNKVTVTKPRFCRCVLRLIRGSNLYQMKWAFRLYDTGGDDLITVNELYDMSVSLPPESLAYRECSKLVHIVVRSLLSISGNKQAESFDFEAFYELIGESCIIKEIIAALTDPSSCHVNKAFEVPKAPEVDSVASSPSPQPVKMQVSLQDFRIK